MAAVVDWILELLLALSPADRERGAEEAADVAMHLSDAQALCLAGALIALWAREEEDHVREAQMNALTALVNQVAVPMDTLAPVLERRDRAIGSEVDYFEEIEEVTRIRGL